MHFHHSRVTPWLVAHRNSPSVGVRLSNFDEGVNLKRVASVATARQLRVAVAPVLIQISSKEEAERAEAAIQKLEFRI
jgi:hypothetical protein